MTFTIIACARCGRQKVKRTGCVNRARAAGSKLYCGRRCSGMARRIERSIADKKSAKAAYDRGYRARDPQRRRADKAAYYQRTRDPVKERARRQARLQEHRAYITAYNADPANKAAKAEYDRDFRAAEYGEFAEAHKLLVQLEREIRSRATKYERAVARGYYQRCAQQRKRNEGISRW